MANISTLLARILTTRYGRDMRQDLHDAIEAVNDDTETALGKSLAFTTSTRKLKLLAKDNTLLSEVVIPGGGSGGGSVDSVNGLFPDENGNVELNLDDINDVDITSVEDGDALIYDSTSGKWVNGAGGGGTSDYTDLSNKPSINGVTLSGNKTSADLGISGGGSNENLLNNAWFTINQRGLGGLSLTNNEQFVVDRWKAYHSGSGSSYIDIRSTGLAINPALEDDYTALRQTLDFSIIDKTQTLSINIDGYGIYTWTFTPTSTSEYYYSNILSYFDCTIQLMFNNNEITVLFKKTVNEDRFLTIRAIKLEDSTTSTLALDTAPDYASELLKCQRYFYPLSGKEYIGFKTSNYEVKVPLPTEMRTTPSISLTGSSIGLSGSAQQGGSISSATVTVSGNEALVNVGLTMAGGGSDYNVCSAFEIFNLVGYLSAEL